MTSERKAAANAANAQKSTGPRSAAGRAKAKMNARRHGLSAASAHARLEARAAALQAQMLQDDPSIPLSIAAPLAQALARREQARQARQDLLENALQQLDPTLPPELRVDLAQLAQSHRLSSVLDHERRAAGAIRKQLRKLCR